MSSFYGRMASTASRLLTQYGKPLTFERVTKTFNKITGNDTARTVAEFSTVGVEVSINQRLVDGTRIQSGDRFIIVDSSYSPAMGDRLRDSPSVSCAYPFNATDADAIALGADGAMAASNAGKTATYTIQSNVPNAPDYSVDYFQFATPFPVTIDLSVGKKVIEFEVDIPTTLTGGTGLAIIGARIASTAGANIVFWGAFLLDDGSVAFTIFNSSLASVIVPGVTYPATVGLCFDADAGTFSAVINGAAVDVSSIGTYTPQVAAIVAAAGESTVPNAVGPADAGKTLAMTLHAGADEITQAYPSGTTDICGNQIGYPQISKSWAIVAIEPISPAGVPVAYRLQVRK